MGGECQFKERAEKALRNTRDGTPLAGDGKTPRLDMGGMLGWEKPHRDIFRKMLCHPKLVPYLRELCGEVGIPSPACIASLQMLYVRIAVPT